MIFYSTLLWLNFVLLPFWAVIKADSGNSIFITRQELFYGFCCTGSSLILKICKAKLSVWVCFLGISYTACSICVRTYFWILFVLKSFWRSKVLPTTYIQNIQPKYFENYGWWELSFKRCFHVYWQTLLDICKTKHPYVKTISPVVVSLLINGQSKSVRFWRYFYQMFGWSKRWANVEREWNSFPS